MSLFLQKLTKHQIVLLLAVLLTGGSAYAQTPSLTLASGSAVKGGVLSLNLSLNAVTNAPAGLEWTLSYAPGDISSLTLASGPVLTSAGKTLACNSGVGVVTCLASGMNAGVISSGVVAVVTATLSSTSTNSLDSIPMSNVMGVFPDGSAGSVSGTGGTITVTQGTLPTVSNLQCNPSSLGSASTSTCTVTLSGAAPTGGASVSLSNTNATLTVPASVTVAAAATSATFTVTTGSVSSSQSATITALYNGSSKTATVTLLASAVVSSLTCNPTNPGPNSTSVCTVILNQPAPTGGVSVALSNTNPIVTVPASVTVAANATTATFNAATAAISSNQSATITATLGASFSVVLTLQPSKQQISFVQAVANEGNAVKSFSVSFPSNTATGNLILLGFDFDANATPSSILDSQGNTFVQVGVEQVSPGGAHSRVYYAKNIKGGPDTVTVNLSANSNFLEMYLTEYAGADLSNPIDAQSGASGVAGAVTSGNANVTVAGDMIYGYCVADWACTPGTGFAARSTLNNNLNEDMIASNTGSYAATGSANNGWTMQMVAIKPASSADVVAPTVPTALTATTASSSQINLSWVASTDNVGVAGYRVLRNGAQVGTATATSYADTGLLAATLYSYTVTAFDGAGNVSAPSIGASATTSPVLPTLTSLSCSTTTLAVLGTSICTVGLNMVAPAGGTVISLTNSNPAALTVPASVTVPALASTAVFTVIAANLTTQQSATVTATLGSASFSVLLTVQAPVLVSTLACNPSSLGQNSTSMCTVALTQPAPAGGAAVTLSNTNSVLTVPASVTVAAAATSATFNVTTGTISSNQSATVTATYNSSSANTAVSLVAPMLVSSVACNPNSLGPNASTSCTVTLTKATSSSGATVTLSSSNAALVVPASVAVAGNATSAAFNATTGAISGNQSATVTATFNSSSVNTVVSLVAPVLVSTLACNPSSLGQNSTSMCTVALTQPAPAGGAAVTLSNTNPVLTVPASVTVAAAATSATFNVTTGTISSNQSASITATYNSSSANTVVSLVAPMLVSSVVCNPNSLGPNASTSCTVTLTKATSSSGATVTLSSNNTALVVPASVAVAGNATSAAFNATTGAISSNQSATVTATFNSSSVNTVVSLVAPVLVSTLACNPNSLGPNSSSICTVTLSQPAPAGGALVTLSNTNPVLTVPASVTVAAAATSATFSVTTGTIASNQAASITATYNNSTAVTGISLVAPMVVSSVACNPNSLGPNASSSCTVSLSKAAPSTGASVTLSNSNPTLTVPASVMVPASASSAAFTATTANFTSNQSATITATYNSSSANTGVSLVAATLVSSLGCNPTTLASGTSSTCTVTLSQPAPAGGTVVTLANNNVTALSVPASILVPAAASSAIFTATAGNPTTSQSATISASYGTSTQTVVMTIQAKIKVTFVQTAAKSVNGAKTLSVSFPSNTAAGNLVLVGFDFDPKSNVSAVSDSQGNIFTQVGAQLTSPGGAVSRVYYAKNIKGGADAVTITLSANSSFLEVYLAEYSGTDPTNPIDAQAGASGRAGAVTSGSANSTVGGDVIYGFCIGDWSCTVGTGFTARSTLNNNLIEEMTVANPGSYAATGFANNGWTMQMVALKPATSSLTSKSMVLTAQAAQVPGKSGASGSGATDARSRSTSTSGSQSAVSALSCTPKAIDAGGQATCELRVAVDSKSSQIRVSSSSQHVKMPAIVATRANQPRLTFQVSADAVAPQQIVTVTAAAGGTTVQDTIQIVAASHPIVSGPGSVMAKRGTPVHFKVTAVDPTDLPIQLTASDLPQGATFDAGIGDFDWTPPASARAGKYPVMFAATNTARQSSSRQVTIEVSSGEPTLARDERECSAGAVASLSGSWLAEAGSALSDPTGKAMDLGGTKVKINGQYVPMVSASPAQVQFVCPVLNPGTQLTVAVETASGSTEPLHMVMRSASPWIFSLDSPQSQGVVSLGGTTELAMARNAQVPAHPAQPGEEILLWGTGFGSPAEISAAMVAIKLGGVDAEVESVRAVPDHAGVYTVAVRVPVPMAFGDAVPVQLQVVGSDGKVFTSNSVTIAVEPVSQ